MNGYLRRWGTGVTAALAMALLTTACLPKGLNLPQSPLLPVLERKSGLVAYLGTDANIYTVDQSGNKPAQVTKDADLEGNSVLFYSIPAWAPDSQSLAFVGYKGQRDGSELPTISLFVAPKDGSTLTPAYSSGNDVIYYYWAPDGQRVAFLTSTPSQSLALKLVSPSGGEVETLDIGAPFYWSWAPDSHSVLVHIGAQDSHLSLLQLGETVTENSLDIKPASFRAPAYSPDGSHMLVAGEGAEGKPALLLADTTGGDLQTITEYVGNIAFAWSPDSTRIAYTTSDDSSLSGLGGHLTVVDPSGKKKPVELKDKVVYAFFWSPDSKSIAYFAAHEEPAPTPKPGESSEDEQPQIVWELSVMDSKGQDTHPVLSPIAPTEHFFRLVPYFDQYHQSATIWSPDSRNLVVSMYYRKNGEAVPGIFVLAASGNLEPRYIADGWVAAWSWK